MLRNLPGKLQDFYVSSPMREGILCWYTFDKNSRVLDLSGGVLTRLLSERCSDVAAGEAGSDDKFNYIVALDPGDFSVEALARYKGHLKDGGRLLLAYENPFGLRYWSGKRAETGIPYDTLIGNSALPSKAELANMLKQAGYNSLKWYYPLTDHWFAREIYSDSCLPNEFLNQRFVPYVADDNTLTFDERNLYREVIRGGAFEFMCGAYLVEATAGENIVRCAVDYAAVTAYREPSKRFATAVLNDGTVRKTALHPDGVASLRRMLANHEELARLGVNVVPLTLAGNSIVMPRIGLPTLWDYWVEKLAGGTFDEDEMFRQLDIVRGTILLAGKSGKCFWELVPANCFYNKAKDEYIFFDQEYHWDGVSPDVAVVRAVWALIYSDVMSADSRRERWVEQLKLRYGLAENWDKFAELARAKTLEVFGSGDDILKESNRHVGRRMLEQHETQLASERRKRLFSVSVQKLRELGYTKPVIYGYGKRGKDLYDVLQDAEIEIVAVVDKYYGTYPAFADIPHEITADAIIVSILDSAEIVRDLKERVNMPVITLEELLNE